MALDPSIPLRVNSDPLYEGLAKMQDAFNPLTQQKNKLALENLKYDTEAKQNQSALAKLKIQTEQRAYDDDTTWRDAYKETGGDLSKLPSILSERGASPELAHKSQEMVSKSRKSSNENEKASNELMAHYANRLLGMGDNVTKADVYAAIQEHSERTGNDPRPMVELVNKIEDSPAAIRRLALGIAGKTDQLTPKTRVINAGGLQYVGYDDPTTGEFVVQKTIKNTATPGDELNARELRVRLGQLNRPETKYNADTGEITTITPPPIQEEGLGYPSIPQQGAPQGQSGNMQSPAGSFPPVSLSNLPVGDVPPNAPPVLGGGLPAAGAGQPTPSYGGGSGQIPQYPGVSVPAITGGPGPQVSFAQESTPSPSPEASNQLVSQQTMPDGSVVTVRNANPNKGQDILQQAQDAGLPVMPNLVNGKTSQKFDQQTYMFGQKSLEKDRQALAGVSKAASLSEQFVAANRAANEGIGMNTGSALQRALPEVLPEIGSNNYQEMNRINRILSVEANKDLKGATSNRDMTVLSGSTLSANNDLAVNENIAKAYKEAEQNAIDKLDFKETYLEVYRNLNGAESAWKKYVDNNTILTPDSKPNNLKFNPDRVSWQEWFKRQNAGGGGKSGGSSNAKANSQSSGMTALPPASQHNGRKVRSSTGEMLQSNGKEWIKVK